MAATKTKAWTMPKPSIGDVVLFSTDFRTFKNPTIGFVITKPGQDTISVLAFTRHGTAQVYDSCHHRDDPALQGDHGWEDLGAWEFAEGTKMLRELKGSDGNVPTGK